MYLLCSDLELGVADYRVIKQVHTVGLSTSDPSMDVDSSRRRWCKFSACVVSRLAIATKCAYRGEDVAEESTATATTFLSSRFIRGATFAAATFTIARPIPLEKLKSQAIQFCERAYLVFVASRSALPAHLFVHLDEARRIIAA